MRTAALIFSTIFLCVARDACSASSECSAEIARGTTACLAFGESESMRGLVFNPPGYQQFYVRSECLQKLAIATREITLCEGVRERRGLFLDGSQISKTSCESKVRQAQERDRRDFELRLERLRNNRSDLARPIDASLDPSPDSRTIKNFDLRLVTAGAFSHAYVIGAKLHSTTSDETIPIYETTTFLGIYKTDALLFSLPPEAFRTIMNLTPEIENYALVVQLRPNLLTANCDRTDISSYQIDELRTQTTFKIKRTWPSKKERGRYPS